MFRTRTSKAVAAFAALSLFFVAAVRGDDELSASVKSPRHVRGAAISGVVLDAGTQRPVADAVVVLVSTGQSADGPSELTDPAGRFVFDGVVTGASLEVRVAKPGYLPAKYLGDLTTKFSENSADASAPLWVRDIRIELMRFGSLSGQILDEAGEPLSGILVRTVGQISLAGTDHLAAGPLGVTDADGRYLITGLYPGRYLVAVPAARPQAVSVPTSAIASSGPLRVGGQTVNVPRVFDGRNLAAGLMPLQRSGEDASGSRYPVTFAPGVSLVASALVVDVKSGDEIEHIDVHLTAVRTGSIRGRVVGGASAMVRLMPGDLSELGIGFEIASAPVTPDGLFVFESVPFGRYVVHVGGISEYRLGQIDPSFLLASIPPFVRRSSQSLRSVSAAPPGTAVSTLTFPGISGEWASVDVTLDTLTLSDVVVPLAGCVHLEGEIRFDPEGSEPKPPASSVSIVAEPADAAPGIGPVAAFVEKQRTDTTLSLPCLQSGRYVLKSGSPGWLVKSVSVNGREIVGQGVEALPEGATASMVVVLTTTKATITGAVRSGEHAATSGRVLVFPAEPEYWSGFGLSPSRIASVTVTMDGRYAFPSLPAGDYFVLAQQSLPVSPWQTASFFRLASAVATRVRVGWNDVRQQDLLVLAPIVR